MDPKDLLPSLEIGPVNYHFAVEPARAEECRVQDLRPVRE